MNLDSKINQEVQEKTVIKLTNLTQKELTKKQDRTDTHTKKYTD